MRLARKRREASFLPHFDQSLGESLKNGLFTVSLTVGVLRDHFEIRETTLFFSNSPQRQHFLNVVIIDQASRFGVSQPIAPQVL